MKDKKSGFTIPLAVLLIIGIPASRFLTAQVQHWLHLDKAASFTIVLISILVVLLVGAWFFMEFEVVAPKRAEKASDG